MRFIAVLRTAETHGFPPPALAEGLAALGADATRRGILVDTAGLLPAATATRIAVAGGRLTVTDGPYADPAPLGAFTLYDVPTRAEAIHWAERYMNLHRSTWPTWAGETELRQIVGPES